MEISQQDELDAFFFSKLTFPVNKTLQTRLESGLQLPYAEAN